MTRLTNFCSWRRLRKLSALSLLLFPVLPAHAQQATAPGKPFPLFNGRNLDGWTASGSPRVFSVDRGAIKATGGVAYLYLTSDIYHGAQFRDFDFKATVKTEGEANAGIFVHVAKGEGLEPAAGIGIQIHNGAQSPNKTGGILNAAPFDKVLVEDGEWFVIEISVRRNLVTTRVNGREVSKHQANGSLQGTLALQSGLPEKGEAWFKDLNVVAYDDPLTAQCTLPADKAFNRTFPDLKELPSGRLHLFGFDEKGTPLGNKMPRTRGFVAVCLDGVDWVGLRNNGTTQSSNPKLESSGRNRVGRIFFTGRASAVSSEGEPLWGGPAPVQTHGGGHKLFDWSFGYNTCLALDREGRILGQYYNPSGNPRVMLPPLGRTDIINLTSLGTQYFGLRANGRIIKMGTIDGSPVSEIPPDANIVEIAGQGYGGHFLARSDDGRVFVVGTGDVQKTQKVPDGLRAKKIRAGQGISAAQRTDGTWVAWGNNRSSIVTKINGFGEKVIDLALHDRAVLWIEEE